MKTLYKIIALTLIDYGLIWLWVYHIDPDPSVSNGLIIYVPAVFIANLIIAAILSFTKLEENSKLFTLNAVIASILMCYLFEKGIDRYQNKELEEWKFKIADTTFSLIRWKADNTFSMTYSLEPGSSSGYLDGKCTKENNGWVLTADSLKMTIDQNDYLAGFRNNATIKMDKIER